MMASGTSQSVLATMESSRCEDLSSPETGLLRLAAPDGSLHVPHLLDGPAELLRNLPWAPARALPIVRR
jgi:hypothetical protein